MAHTKINRIESKRHTRRTFDQDDLVFASYLILKAPIHSSDTHLYFKTSSQKINALSHDCSIEHAKYCVVNPKKSSVLMYGASLSLCRLFFLPSGVFWNAIFSLPLFITGVLWTLLGHAAYAFAIAVVPVDAFDFDFDYDCYDFAVSKDQSNYFSITIPDCN